MGRKDGHDQPRFNKILKIRFSVPTHTAVPFHSGPRELLDGLERAKTTLRIENFLSDEAYFSTGGAGDSPIPPEDCSEGE